MTAKYVKSADNFKNVFETERLRLTQADELFAKNLSKPGKNIEGCVSYSINQVKKSKMTGFDDETIFGLTAHYYDKDNIKVSTRVQYHIVSNHHVELTEEEIRDAKKDAKAEIQHYETIRLKQEAEKEFKAGIIKEQRDKN